jgi:GxxExxY protein
LNPNFKGKWTGLTGFTGLNQDQEHNIKFDFNLALGSNLVNLVNPVHSTCFTGLIPIPRPTSMSQVTDEITDRIIGCCFKVHKVLGAGFVEKVYGNALMIELAKCGLKAQQQVPITVKYDDRVVGEYFADILVEDSVICELKANQVLLKEHEVQLVNYLVATGIDVGLLINFGKSVTVKRKFREYKNRND